MNVKRWLVGLFLVLLLGSEIFLFIANQQKNAAVTALGAAQQEAAQLQAELDQYQNSSAVAQSNEIARLRRDNVTLSQNLASALNSLGQLRSTNKLLTSQLVNAGAYLQQQQGQLEQIAEENQRTRAAAQTILAQQKNSDALVAASQRNTCINNLRQIDAAKNQWALENNKTADAVPTLNDLAPYLKDGIFPACPAGGLYSINSLNQPPTCSVPGHVLP